MKTQKLFSSTVRELKKLSDTRWSCRSSSIVTVRETYPALLLSLRHLEDDVDNEVFFDNARIAAEGGGGGENED